MKQRVDEAPARDQNNMGRVDGGGGGGGAHLYHPCALLGELQQGIMGADDFWRMRSWEQGATICGQLAHTYDAAATAKPNR